MHILWQQAATGPKVSVMPSMMQRASEQRRVKRWSLHKDEQKGREDDFSWSQTAFPSYLQSRDWHKKDVCWDFDQAVTAAERKQSHQMNGSVPDEDSIEEEDTSQFVWWTIRREAERDAAAEPILSSFLYATILAHDSFERALAFVLSNRLANAVMLPTQLFETFYAVLVRDSDVRLGALADVEACKDRDPACTSYSQALLYYKGYHAIQTHRIAHALWKRGQKVMAVALQSRMSEVLAVDIHPAARLGHGILLDHGTGVVIGETAVIGNNVSLLQNVTLGGTGKQHGDRHPKISNNVLIGASSTVLGNITVGEGSQIAAGSLVLKAVPPHTMVAGSPAKPVGTVTGNPAEKMQQWSKKFMDYDPVCDPVRSSDNSTASAGPAAEPAAESRPSSSSAAAAVESKPRKASKRKPTMLDAMAAEAAWDAYAAETTGKQSGQSGSQSNKPAPMHVHVNAVDVHSNGNGHPNADSHRDGVYQVVEQPQSQMQPQELQQHDPQQHLHISVDGTAHPQQQQQWQPVEAQQYMFEQVTGHQHLQPLQDADHSPQPQQQQQQQQQQPPPQQQQQQQQPQPQQQAQEQPQQASAAVQSTSQQQGTAEVPAVAAAGKKGAELRGIHGGEVEATIDEAIAAQKWANRKEDPEYVI